MNSRYRSSASDEPDPFQSFFSDASIMITGATICASIVAASVLAEAASIADDVHSIIIADEESVGEAG